ncbi:hypothetical protein M9Y10_004635 [Tritrichomonas musculus]|uniref:Uncharacterized protein n=1 Tax=Tritrichomonas musculus TaxID=1915356 RepID=A0ABR2JJ83_9EUKA
MVAKFNNTFTNDMLYPEYKYFMSISLHDIDTEIKKSVEKQYGFFIDDFGKQSTLQKEPSDAETFYMAVDESSVKPEPPKPKAEPTPTPEPKPEPISKPTKIKASMILESEPLKKIKMIPAKTVSSIAEEQINTELEEKRKKLNLPPVDYEENWFNIKEYKYTKLNKKLSQSIKFEIEDIITSAAITCDEEYQKITKKLKVDNKDRQSEKWKSLFAKIYPVDYEDRIGIKPLKMPKGNIVIDSTSTLDSSANLVDKNDIKHVFNHRLNNPIPPHVKHEAEEKAKRDAEEKVRIEAEQQRLQELFVNSKLNELKSSPPPKLKSDFEPVKPPSQLPTIEDKPFEDMESAGSIDNSSLQTQQQETYNNFMNPDFDDEFASDEYNYAFDHVI